MRQMRGRRVIEMTRARDADDLYSLIERQHQLIEGYRGTVEDQTETIAELRDRLADQQATIDDQQATIKRLHGAGQSTEQSPLTRRSALKAGGLVGLLGLGVETTSASDPTGQVGTEDRPIETLYAAGLNGPLTGGQELTSIVGDGLDVQEGELVSTGTEGVETPTLSIEEIVGIQDLPEDVSSEVHVTVAETNDLTAEDIEVTIEIDGTGYEATREASDLRDGSDTVTFDDEDEIGPFDAGEEFTATVTVDARNAPTVTSTDEFSIEPTFAGGDGSEDDPYQIDHWGGLDAVREHRDDHFVLVGDVGPESAGYDALVDTPDGGWEPIADSDDEFTGTFDGDGHEIQELVIDRGDGVGLFDRVHGHVENVGVVDADVTGSEYVGPLVGLNDGTVEGSYATGSVTGEDRVGGLVGHNIATVEWSYATGSVTSEERVGGLIGSNLGTVEGSYATSSVTGNNDVGGLAGVSRVTGTITESYATGGVTGDEDVGGFIGNDDGDVDHSYWDVPASSQDDSDGGTGIGDLEDEPPADGMVGAVEDLDDDLAEDFDFAETWEAVSEDDEDAGEDDYPVLQALDRETQLEARE